MADFYQAIKIVLKNEGGFVDDPKDPGGATNMGISFHYYKTIDPDATIDNIKNLTLEMAENIYLKYFWVATKYCLIEEQLVATKMLDLSVNIGEVNANKCMQRALRANNRIVDEDGIIGTTSMYAINHTDSAPLLTALKSEAACHYRQQVMLFPSQIKFLAGWLHRAYSEPT